MKAAQPPRFLRTVALASILALSSALASAQTVVWDGTTALADTALGGNTIPGGTTLNITTGNNHDFYGVAIVNHGTVNWSGGQLRAGGGGTITNHSGWNDTASSSYVYIIDGATPVFTNAITGVYTKSGAGTTHFAGPVAFNNDGDVYVETGTLQLSGGGTNSATGVIYTGAGATTLFSNSYTIANGSALTGPGAYQLAGGTLSLDGEVAISTFNHTGGQLAGTHTFGGNSQVNWIGGSWSTAGTTTIGTNATVTISSGNDHDFYGRALINEGTVNWTGGQIRSGGGGTITNHAQWNDSASNTYVYIIDGAAPVFTNALTGIYVKSAPGTTQFNAPVVFNNDGLVFVEQGTLALNGGGTNSSTGIIHTALGATTLFSNSYTVADGSALTGPGAYTLTGGTLTVDGLVEISSFNQSGGALAGTHTFDGGSQASWSGGNWNTGGTTTIGTNATLTISTANDHDFYTRHIVNDGTVNWTGGQIRSGGGGTITNHGEWNDTASSAYVYIIAGTPPVFHNTATGTYNKDGTGTTVFNNPVAFNNDGVVNVNDGTLQFNGGGTNSSTGVIHTAAGAITHFSNSFTIANGSALSGPGAYTLTGGTLTVDGSVAMSTFSQTGGQIAGTHTFGGSSQVTWTGGDWNTGGTTTIGPDATLNITSGNDHDYYGRAIINEGTINWSGGQVRSGGGGTITNEGVWNDTAASSFVYITGGATPVFTNSATGVYNKNSAGTTHVSGSVAFNNDGLVNVSAGTFQLTGGGTNSSTGVIYTADGATTLFSNSYTIAAGSALTGPGAYSLTGGTFTINGLVDISTFNQSGGTLAGTQTFDAGSRVNWIGGNWNTSGTTTIASGAILTISSGNDHDYYGRSLVNDGVVNWTGGTIRTGGGGSITNNGAWNDAAAGSFAYITGGVTPVFTNAETATFTKTTAGTTSFSNPVAVINAGTMRVNAGTLAFGGAFTNSDGTLHAAGGNFSFANPLDVGTGALLGTGTFTATSVTAGGIVAPGNPAGLMTIAGNLNLLPASSSRFDIGGDTRGTEFDGLDVTGTAAIAGSLEFSFIYGGYASLQNADVFTLLNAGALTGGFGNIASGSRLDSADGVGSFRVDVTGTSVTLSQFQLGPNTYIWAGGNLNTPGNVTPALLTSSTVPAGAHLAISTSADHDFNGTTLTNNGTIDWAIGSGALRSGNAGAIVNAGVWNDASSSNFNNAFNGTLASFQNTADGVYRKTTGTSTIVVPFHNSGTVDVSGGTLSLSGGGTINDGAAFTGASGARLTGGTFTASGTFSSTSLALAGAALTGTFTLGEGTLTFESGDLNGSNLTIGADATLVHGSAADFNFNAADIVNAGTFHWAAAAGPLRSGNGGTFSNEGLFLDAAANQVNNAYNGALAQFSNEQDGLYLKTANTQTTFAVPFTNRGTVTVSAGTLALNAGGVIEAGATFDGAGQTVLNDGTFTATGLFDSTNLVLGGTATLTGAHAWSGRLTWTSGNFNTATTTTIPSGSTLQINSAVNHDYNGHTLRNEGIANWTAGPLRSGNGGMFLNEITGVFNDTASNAINNDYGGIVGANFTNQGRFNKTAAGTTTVSVPFHNAGTVTVTNGTLSLNAGGTISAGADYTGAGQTLLNAGTFTASGLFTSANLVLGGSATLAGNTSLDGKFTWTTGNFNHASTTTIPHGAILQINGATNHDFNTHTLSNAGTVKWTAGELRSGNGGAFVNQFNGVFIDTASSAINNDYGGTTGSSFTNHGVYNKTAVSTTTVTVPFHNTGAVEVGNGTLSLNAGGTISAGATFTGTGQTLLNSGTYTATGLFHSTNLVLGGSAELAGNASLGGTVTWTSGNFNNADTTTIPAGATLDAVATTSGNHDYNAHTLVNDGTFNWSAGMLRSGNGGSITNNGLFRDTASSTINNAFGGVVSSVFNNQGVYRKTSAGTTTVAVPFHNFGQVDVLGGTLALTAGGTINDGASFTGAGTTRLVDGTFFGEASFSTTNLILAGATLQGTPTFDGLLTWENGLLGAGAILSVDFDGMLSIATTANHDLPGADLVNNGMVHWTGGAIRSGNAGAIENAGTWHDEMAAGVINNAYNGTLATFLNEGLYFKSTTGSTTFQLPVTNTGAFFTTGGQLRFSNGFTQSGGVIFLANGATLQFDSPVDLSDGVLVGSGTIIGAVTNNGEIVPTFGLEGSGAGTLTFTTSLSLEESSTLTFHLAGLAPGTEHDRISVAGFAALGGNLSIGFANDFHLAVSPDDHFTLLTAGSLSGAFLNVANGDRLFTFDGLGSFQVNYGLGSAFAANSLVLSAYAVPEPSTVLLLALGASVMVFLRRRRA